MHPLTFQAIVTKRQELIQQVLGTKAQEYALGGDRLHNFKIAARMAGITPEQALMGMDLKHRVCIEDLVERRLPLTAELITEKIGDHINYMILLEALLIERLGQGMAHSTAPLAGRGVTLLSKSKDKDKGQSKDKSK